MADYVTRDGDRQLGAALHRQRRRRERLRAHHRVALEHWDDWCAAWCAGADEHLRPRRRGPERGPPPQRRRVLRARGDLLPLRASSSSCTTPTRRATPTRARSTALNRRAAPPRPARASRGDPLRRLDAGRASFARPARTGPHPTVLLIPGLDSTKEEFREVERSFLDRGMATFALDGPGQGEVEWTLPIRPEWESRRRGRHRRTCRRCPRSTRRASACGGSAWAASTPRASPRRTCRCARPSRSSVPTDFGAAWKNLNPLTRARLRGPFLLAPTPTRPSGARWT